MIKRFLFLGGVVAVIASGIYAQGLVNPTLSGGISSGSGGGSATNVVIDGFINKPGASTTSTLSSSGTNTIGAIALSVVNTNLFLPTNAPIALYGVTNGQTNVTLYGTFSPQVYKALPRLQTGMANVQAGLSNTTILVIGTSHIAGYGATGASTPTNCVVNSPPWFWSQQIPGANYDWVIGTHNYGLGIADPRVTFSTNWTISGSTSLDGPLIAGAAGTTNPITFTPYNKCSRVKIFYHDNFNLGSANVYDENWTLLGKIVPTNSPAVFTNKTFYVAYGTHTFYVCPVVTNTAVFYYDGIGSGTSNSIDIYNLGLSGSQSTNWNFLGVSGYNNIPQCIKSLNPDVALIELGVNEDYYSTPVSVYVTNMVGLVTNLASANISVGLVTPAPTATPKGLTNYVAALRGLAYSNNIPIVVDLYDYFGSTANMRTNGLLSPLGELHESMLGGVEHGLAYYHYLPMSFGLPGKINGTNVIPYTLDYMTLSNLPTSYTIIPTNHITMIPLSTNVVGTQTNITWAIDTTNFGTMAYVGTNGNVSINGTMTATNFSGSGAGLTGIPIGAISSWSNAPSAFTNITAVRIPVYTNGASIVFYLTLSTNQP